MNTDSHGLMARMPHGNPGSHHDWVSRDHADVDCRAVGCFFNRAEKCMVPSRCVINDQGSCAGFQAKAMPQQIDGD